MHKSDMEWRKKKTYIQYIIIVAVPALLQSISIAFLWYRNDLWRDYASDNQLPQQYQWVDQTASRIFVLSMFFTILTQIICGILLYKTNARSFPVFIVLSLVIGFVLGFINFAALVALY